MRKLLFLALALCFSLQLRAQFATVNDDIKGTLVYPTLLGGVAWDADGEHEVFGIRGEYVTKGVLVSEIVYTYSSVYSGCVESARFMVTRQMPTYISGGLISRVVEGYTKTEIVEVGFHPVDKEWRHWRGSLIANPANEREIVKVEYLDSKVVKKSAYNPQLIESK